MRRLILYIASSFDGYIAGPNNELDWLFTEGDYGYNEFFDSVDTVFSGRITYDEAVKMGMKDPFPGKTTYVFTTKSSDYNSTGHLIFTSEDPVKLWKSLRDKEGKNAWLVGGGELIKYFIEQDLIDEYRIFVHPIILGKGIHLFKQIDYRVNLKTEEVKKFDSGLVMLKLRTMSWDEPINV